MVEITREALYVIMLNEVNEYKQFYGEFGQENVNVQKYVTEKTYNSEAGDMILSILCNALGAPVIIYMYSEGQQVLETKDCNTYGHT